MSRNLLQGRWTPERIREILSRHPAKPLLPALDSPRWEQVRQNAVARDLAAPLCAKAEAEIGEPPPPLTDELYAAFGRTGVRIDFEKVYFERRRRLARAATALLLCPPDDPRRDRLIASTIEKFTAIFEEESWAVPAHVHWTTENATGKEPLQIDLFCAETANLMAEMLDIFGAILPAALKMRVRQRLQSDIFENYLRRHDEFIWTRVTHNWNAVCHQGILGAALSQADDATLVRLLLLAREGLPHFLEGFTKDGGCTEGVGYWSYGFGWFAFLNEQLETRTGGEISLFEDDARIRAIARFGSAMALANAQVVNFGDNRCDGRLNPGLLAYLGARLGEGDLTRRSRQIYRDMRPTGVEPNGQRCDLFYVGRILLRSPSELPPSETGPPADCFLPDLAVIVAHGIDEKGRRWDFAAKAGHNGEHHNHNDCGSYLLNIDGVRLIAEIGSPEYVKDFFRAETRYEFLAARTFGHSLPIINGCEQKTGADHASRIIFHSREPDRALFQLDATACYPAEAACKKFTRSLRFDKHAGRLSVEDVFELARMDTLESAVIAVHPILSRKDHAIVDAGKLQLAIRPRAGTRIDRIETHPYRTHDGRDAFIQRLVLVPEKLSGEIRLAVEMTLS